LLYENILLVETGGIAQNAISAFDIHSGKVLWTAGGEGVLYQSPYLLETGDGFQFVGITNGALYGLQPGTGQILWRFEHGGGGRSSGVASGNLVPVGDKHFFLKHTDKSGMLFKIKYGNETYQAEEVWQTKDIKGTFVVPVYHDGHVFGYSTRIFACINTESGERIWRSRSPGDGFPIVVDGHLVVATKDGKLSVAPASPEGYHEIVRLDLFDNLVWSPASFAKGRLFLRSMTEIAAVDIVHSQPPAEAASNTDGILPNSELAKFMKKVERAANKNALVGQFMNRQKEFPIIEGEDIVHFVYRGEANDMALVGDLFGRRYDRPMHRVAGTDLFYYSSKLESDARLTYKFQKDFQTPLVDSLNSRSIQSMHFGQASWFSMPNWRKPTYFEAPTSAAGRIDSLQFTSAINDSSRMIEVYLPAGYEQGSQKYPVIFVHRGSRARRLGNMVTALDNLIGSSIRPVIAVFMPTFHRSGYREFVGSDRDIYIRIMVEEILPLVKQNYRVLPGPGNRLNMGHQYGAFMALYSTLKHRNLFGKLSIQSLRLDEKDAKAHLDLLVPDHRNKLQIYVDWGKYDFRSPLEGENVTQSNRTFAALLKRRGFQYTGGEVSAGTGWGSWKNRIDKVLETFFPIEQHRE
jgi:enterochelin esterase-like enzyme